MPGHDQQLNWSINRQMDGLCESGETPVAASSTGDGFKSPPSFFNAFLPLARRTLPLTYHAIGRRADSFNKWIVPLAIARTLENRSHERAEFAFLSDDAIRSGSACGDSRLE